MRQVIFPLVRSQLETALPAAVALLVALVVLLFKKIGS